MKTIYNPLYKSLLEVFNRNPVSKISFGLMVTALTCMPAMAAQDEGVVDNDMPRVTLPAITVTATRTPTAVNNTIAQIRVIDSEDLKRYQGQTVIDVIKKLPGFSYFSNGGMGTNSNFYLRGYDSKQILVLIDGVRTSSVSTGQAALSLLPADQIERIEVLYGASGSSIYGADAMGGVIQIFTKGTNVNNSQLSVTVGAGSHDQFLYGATAQ
ncbi:TonB-dependent receptor plug domain-containing protein, partial [Psychrobacter sp.]|uniref:TonB-dependent receptor n=1 Tax=Psychrobacter sp. TaxID=56811 RepID=UPI0025DD48DB